MKEYEFKLKICITKFVNKWLLILIITIMMIIMTLSTIVGYEFAVFTQKYEWNYKEIDYDYKKPSVLSNC